MNMRHEYVSDPSGVLVSLNDLVVRKLKNKLFWSSDIVFKIIDQILIKKLSKSWYTGAGLNRAAGTSSLIFENLVFVIASQQAHIKVGDLLPRRKPIKLYTCHGDYFWKICKINGLILVMQLMRRKKIKI